MKCAGPKRLATSCSRLSCWRAWLLACSLLSAWSPAIAADSDPPWPSLAREACQREGCKAVRPTVRDCEKRIAHDGTNWRAAATGAAVYWTLPQSDLIIRLIDRRENREWNTTALSSAGAVGLTQIKPITVCRYTPGCAASDKSRLDALSQRLRSRPRFALCWAGKILSRLLTTCGSAGLGCAVSAYYTGEVGAIYAADVLNN